MNCTLCPRNCNVNRAQKCGLCGTHGIVLSRVASHAWEEPCISGSRGSGTVFFAGCNLKCRFCQNFDISVVPHGVEVSPARLADVFLHLQDTGVANINLVTAAHVSDGVTKALEIAKPHLTVPVVYNTGSYEKLSAIRNLNGLVDVYLPDLKFASSDVSAKLAAAPDYFQVATAAITEMHRQQPKNLFDDQNYIQKGLIVRHLVLPGFVEDTKLVLDWLAQLDKNITVSLMSQYFPARHDDKFPQLNRRLFKHEYRSAVDYFFNLGLTNGFTQDVSSATVDYLPEFSDTQIADFLQNTPYVFEKSTQNNI